jgi:ABC-2 type transport system ATP-binding protein
MPLSKTPIGRVSIRAIVGAGYARAVRLVTRGLAALLVVAAVAVGVGWSPSAPTARTAEVSLVMDDGVSLAGTLYLPDGTAPAGGWPGIVALHGIAGTRAQIAAVAEALQARDYAVVAYDARGHGQSGGLF